MPSTGTPHLEHCCGARGVAFDHAGRPAGEDDRAGLRGFQRLRRLVERHDLAIDARFAHAPRDELRELGAEIDDQNGDGHGGI